MKKRLLSLLLALVMLVGMIPATSLTATVATTDTGTIQNDGVKTLAADEDEKVSIVSFFLEGDVCKKDKNGLYYLDTPNTIIGIDENNNEYTLPIEEISPLYSYRDYTGALYSDPIPATSYYFTIKISPKTMENYVVLAVDLTNNVPGFKNISIYASHQTDDGGYKLFCEITRNGIFIANYVPLGDGEYLACDSFKPQTTKPSGGYAYYNDGELTLNNYSYEGEGYYYNSSQSANIYSRYDLTVNLIGTNTLTNTAEVGRNIYIEEGSLTVGGTGSLNFTTSTEYVNGTSLGLFALRGIVINGGTFNGENLYGINSGAGDLIVNDGVFTLVATYNALVSNKNIVINGGRINAISTATSAIYFYDSLTIADDLEILAFTTQNGTPGEYVPGTWYKKIVITPVECRSLGFASQNPKMPGESTTAARETLRLGASKTYSFTAEALSANSQYSLTTGIVIYNETENKTVYSSAGDQLSRSLDISDYITETGKYYVMEEIVLWKNGERIDALRHIFPLTIVKEALPSVAANVTVPVFEGTPSDAVLSSESQSDCTITKTEWYKRDTFGNETKIDSTHSFEVNGRYRCYVTFAPVAGTYFSPATAVYINGEKATLSGSIGDTATYYVTYDVDTDNLPVLLTDASFPKTGSSMTVDIEAMAELSEDIMEAYFNGEISVEWYVDGTRVESAHTSDFGEKLEVKAEYNGKEVYAKFIYGSKSLTGKTYTITGEVCTIGFDANGGSNASAHSAVALNKGSAYTLPECKFTAPAGYVFKAWEVNGVEYAPGAQITVNDNVTAVAVWEEAAVTVSGTVTSFGSTTDTITVELWKEGATSATYSTTTKGNSAVYSIEGVTEGTYTIKVIKAYHIIAEEVITVSEDTTKDIALREFSIAGANMTLGNELSMNFFVKKADINNNYDYYIKVTKTYADGREDVVRTFTKDMWTDYNSTYYSVKFNGVSAKEMTDTVYVQIFYVGGTPASDVWVDSVEQYALRILEKQDSYGKTVLVDMLNYGAAAQQEFGYNLSKLANANLSETQKGYATKSTTATDKRVKGTNYYGSNLTLKSNLMFNIFYQNITPDMYAIITFTKHTGEAKNIRVEGSEFVKYNETTYRVPIDEIVVADARQLVTCNVYNSSGTLIASASDSVESYIARMSSTGAIYDTIMKFADSAYSYFHNR